MKKKLSLLFIAYAVICVIVIYSVLFKTNQANFTNVENRTLATNNVLKEKISLENFNNESFQDYLSDLSNDQFPLKEIFLKINLNLEKKKSDILSSILPNNYLIKVGNYYRISGSNAYIDYPLVSGEYSKSLFENRMWNFDRIAEKYGDKYKLYIYKPTSASELSCFDSYDIYCEGDDYYNELCNRLGDTYKIKKQEINDVDEYLDKHYHTDHHWNYKGAYEGYQDIINMIGEDFDIGKPYDIKEIKEHDREFYGSLSSKAMNTLGSDKFITYELDYEKIYSYYINNEESELGLKEKIFESPEYEGYMYEDYYGHNEKIIKIVNYKNLGGKSILVLGDSFSNAINEDIAAHFENTYIVDSRFWLEDDPSNSTFSLDDFLKHNDVDCILWLQFYTSLYFDSTCYLHIDLDY